MRRIHVILRVILLILSIETPSFAINVEVSTKEKELITLNLAINKLKKNLVDTEEKETRLLQEAKQLDQIILHSSKETREMKGELSKKNQKLITLRKKLEQVSYQINHQKKRLAKQVKMMYQLGCYPYLSVFFNDDNSMTVIRLTTYYQYLNRYRINVINQFHRLKNDYLMTEKQIDHELLAHNTLNHQLIGQQALLIKQKEYKQAILSVLDQKKKKNQDQLKHYLDDKQKLEQLLLSLKKKEDLIHFTTSSFGSKHHQLKWPIKGELLKKDKQTIQSGITILSASEQDIRSVYSGKVVFSGWLRGYGLLLIIDHGSGYMTLYAQSASLYKKKGDLVKEGEAIAKFSPDLAVSNNNVGLYFEVRYQGKSSDPLQWLV